MLTVYPFYILAVWVYGRRYENNGRRNCVRYIRYSLDCLLITQVSDSHRVRMQHSLTDTPIVFPVGIHDSGQKEGARSVIRRHAASDRLHEVGRNALSKIPLRSVSSTRFLRSADVWH